MSRRRHDRMEIDQEGSDNDGEFIVSQSGKVVKDISYSDVEEMADEVNKAEGNAQEVYDKHHDKINTLYAMVKESINTSRRCELEALDDNQENVMDSGKNMVDERKEILEKYQELDEKNLSDTGELKGTLRYLVGIDRKDLVLRGVDENDEDAVAFYEENLKSDKTTESDKESAVSLVTHNPLDPKSSDKTENTVEGSSKISESADKRSKDSSEEETADKRPPLDSSEEETAHKRPRLDSSEEESSRKRPRQDSSDVESEGVSEERSDVESEAADIVEPLDPFDIF